MSIARMNDFFESWYLFIPMNFPLQLNTRMANIRVQQLKCVYSLWCEYGSDVENSTINSSEIPARILVKLLNADIYWGWKNKRNLIHGPDVATHSRMSNFACRSNSTRNYSSYRYRYFELSESDIYAKLNWLVTAITTQHYIENKHLLDIAKYVNTNN